MTLPREQTTIKESTNNDTAGDSSNTAHLAVVFSPDGSKKGSELALGPGDATLVGRDVDGGLRIEDSRISRAHLRIVWDPIIGGYRFADLQSANGTFINGRRLGTAILAENDVIRVGDTLLIFCSAQNDRFDELARRIAPSTLPVLVLGETGSGKELIARLIHEASGRSGSFVPINCAALPRELAAAELFGHTRGAFSGAGSARPGLFRAASGGTLFLDEIGDMPKDVQPSLLRALQEKSVRPVGSDAEIRVDVRIVAATHADLEAYVADGSFREDLLARLAHLIVRIPPLRKRRRDILELARMFAPELALSPSAAEALLIAEWPRNVRELRTLMESLTVLGPDDKRVLLAHLADRLPEAVECVMRRESTVQQGRATNRREMLSTLLRKHQGNVAAVAREVGKPRSQIYRWLKAMGLSKNRFHP